MSDNFELTVSRAELEQLFDALTIQQAIETVLIESRGDAAAEEDILKNKIMNLLGWRSEETDQAAEKSHHKLADYDDLQFEDELLWRRAINEAEKEVKRKKLKLNREQKFELACQKYDELFEEEEPTK
ncbi:MAG: hypothetical protein WCT39_04140 [Candidatus Margulisiibacteriota bacterium]